MPPIDPSIIMGIRPAQIQQRDPLESYGKSLALQNLMRQGDMQGLQFEEAQRGADTSRRLDDAYRQAGGDNARLRSLLPGVGAAGYRALQELDKAELDAQAKRAAIDKDKASAGKSENEVRIQNAERAASMLSVARQDPNAYGAVRRLIQASYPQLASRLPEQFDAAVLDGEIANGISYVDKLKAEQEAQKIAETGRHNRTTETNTVRGQNLTAQVAREGHGVTVRGQNMTDARGRDLAQATRDATATGRIPPGYRQTANGDLEAIPGGPADKVNTKGVETQRTLDAYVAARDGLMSGLEKTYTGALSGRMPAMSTGQQIAEGGVAAMAPVLKQLFRAAGEGVFTDRDQQLLMDMVPKRTDNPAAAAEKMANIDRIVAAKLGVPVPARAAKPEGTWAVVR